MGSKNHILPPVEEILEYLELDKSSPSGFRWKSHRGHVKAGDVAGTKKNDDGRWAVTLNGKRYYCYRLKLYIETGIDPGVNDVDHKYRDLDDHRNIRIATKSQNNANRRKREFVGGRSLTSKYKGVYWCKKARKWVAMIRYKRKGYYLGSYISEKQAAYTYNKAAELIYGEFAYKNELDGEQELSLDLALEVLDGIAAKFEPQVEVKPQYPLVEDDSFDVD